MDIAKGEQVERELDALFTRRHDRRVPDEGERPLEEAWMESERRYEEEQRLQARYEWHAFHCGQAQRHRRTLQELVSFHDEAKNIGRC